MHETKEAGVYVAGLREDIVSSPEQVGGLARHLLEQQRERQGAAVWQVLARGWLDCSCRSPAAAVLAALLSCNHNPMAVGVPQVLELLESGERHRHFGETKMNKNSSRSHTIFRMVVESRSRDANPDDAQVGRRCCCASGLP